MHSDIMNTAPAPLTLFNVQVLTPHGWLTNSAIHLRAGRIQAVGHDAENLVGADGTASLDGQGAWLLPGIIDLHGDAFERHITPRAGTQFPLALALAANDASLVANGITTFYYSITDGFEPGPRSRDAVRRILKTLQDLMPRFSCQARIHIRHEKVNTAGHEELLEWLANDKVHMLSLNDHLPPLDDPRKVERYLAGLRRRVSMGNAETDTFLRERQSSRELGERQTHELVATAHHHGVAIASHDDETLDDVNRNIALKGTIAEFPMSAEVARASRDAGIAVLMGAPNLVRGGSHVGAISVQEALQQELVDVLCSDYHYSSLFHAPFMQAQNDPQLLAETWKLVSENPACAAGIGDHKGRIAPGYDADLLLVSHLDGLPLSLEKTFVRGRVVYMRDPLH